MDSVFFMHFLSRLHYYLTVDSFLENLNEIISHYLADPKFNFDQLAEIMGKNER